MKNKQTKTNLLPEKENYMVDAKIPLKQKITALDWNGINPNFVELKDRVDEAYIKLNEQQIQLNYGKELMHEVAELDKWKENNGKLNIDNDTTVSLQLDEKKIYSDIYAKIEYSKMNVWKVKNLKVLNIKNLSLVENFSGNGIGVEVVAGQYRESPYTYKINIENNYYGWSPVASNNIKLNNDKIIMFSHNVLKSDIINNEYKYKWKYKEPTQSPALLSGVARLLLKHGLEKGNITNENIQTIWSDISTKKYTTSTLYSNNINVLNLKTYKSGNGEIIFVNKNSSKDKWFSFEYTSDMVSKSTSLDDFLTKISNSTFNPKILLNQIENPLDDYIELNINNVLFERKELGLLEKKLRELSNDTVELLESSWTEKKGIQTQATFQDGTTWQFNIIENGKKWQFQINGKQNEALSGITMWQFFGHIEEKMKWTPESKGGFLKE